jgi:hypothetical protein
MSVVDIVASPFLQDSSPAPSEFKITSKAAAVLIRGLIWRVIWHRITAAILMAAALAAIGGGIALIFYAGELAKQQRSADVTALMEHESELRRQRDQIINNARDDVRSLLPRDTQLHDLQLTVQELQQKLADAKSDGDRQSIQTKLNLAKDDVETARRDIMKAAKESVVPLDASIKDLDERIAGSSTVLEYNSILIRVAAVLLIVFLVQTFITVFRYMTRLAAYYQARVDALQLAGEQDLAIADLQKMTSVLSPEAYDFGKVARTPAEQASDLARAIIANQKKAD